MNCIKCGQEIPEEQAFCESCLAGMEQHPVNPATVVLLPKNHTVGKKMPQRRRPSLEEQVLQLKKKLRISRILAALLFVLLVGVSAVAYTAILRLDVQKLWGQNYSTVTTTDTTQGTDSSGSTGAAAGN